MSFHEAGVSALERKKFITPDEFKKLLAVTKKTDEASWFLFYLIGNLGLRVGEAHKLRAVDIQVSNRIVRISTEKQKKEVEDDLPVPEAVAQTIAGWIKRNELKAGDLLFPWGVRTSQKLFGRYAKLAGLAVTAKQAGKNRKGRGIHCLRHMRGMWATNSGANIKEIQATLRQRSPSAALVYMHTVSMEKLVNKMGELR